MDGLARPNHSVVHFSEAFVICAGSVLFRKDAEERWQMCVLHHRTDHVFVLPKGRKDRGETAEEAAVRETYEETGYPCKLLPCNMTTRAPPPHVNMRDEPYIAQDAAEPFAVTLRELKGNGTKIIWWYLTVATGEKETETQTESENFFSEFVPVEDAIRQLTFSDDKDVARRARDLVVSDYTAGDAA
ncbi:hypothetical protein ID866_5620 [Astraeus odoratus]|nr:hypothetical protein ID866_5620 [Astraeus odoratus]